MSKVRIELNRDGVRDLLRSREMLEICEAQARRVAADLDANATLDSRPGKNRVNVSISSNNRSLSSNALQKALRSSRVGGGRL